MGSRITIISSTEEGTSFHLESLPEDWRAKKLPPIRRAHFRIYQLADRLLFTEPRIGKARAHLDRDGVIKELTPLLGVGGVASVQGTKTPSTSSYWAPSERVKAEEQLSKAALHDRLFQLEVDPNDKAGAEAVEQEQLARRALMVFCLVGTIAYVTQAQDLTLPLVSVSISVAKAMVFYVLAYTLQTLQMVGVSSHLFQYGRTHGYSYTLRNKAIKGTEIGLEAALAGMAIVTPFLVWVDLAAALVSFAVFLVFLVRTFSAGALRHYFWDRIPITPLFATFGLFAWIGVLLLMRNGFTHMGV